MLISWSDGMLVLRFSEGCWLHKVVFRFHHLYRRSSPFFGIITLLMTLTIVNTANYNANPCSFIALSSCSLESDLRVTWKWLTLIKKLPNFKCVFTYSTWRISRCKVGARRIAMNLPMNIAMNIPMNLSESPAKRKVRLLLSELLSFQIDFFFWLFLNRYWIQLRGCSISSTMVCAAISCSSASALWSLQDALQFKRFDWFVAGRTFAWNQFVDLFA